MEKPSWPKKILEGDLIEVRFTDITTEDTWTSIETARNDKPSRGKLTGYYLNEDETTLRILSMVLEDSDCGYILIPRGMITHVRLIEEGELNDFEGSEE
jgi:hypothetical protein